MCCAIAMTVSEGGAAVQTDPKKYARQFPRDAENTPDSFQSKQLLVLAVVFVLVLVAAMACSRIGSIQAERPEGASAGCSRL
jgi:hypothetical protein